MAYGFKYLFRFLSQNGDTFQIQVEKEGYSGDIIKRSLGAPPKWKRERNGHICGSSIEFFAECRIDGEFSEFYTSDPHEFRVTLVNENGPGVLFRGYISPELYAEPDIAPPYDVRVIATDGLGELRRYFYEPLGTQPLYYILETILAKTGLNTDYWCNNATLEAGGSASVPAAKFLDYASVNIDHLAGKSYYEVLEWLMNSLHADIFQTIDSGGYHTWQILRETDVESGATVVAKRGSEGYDDTVTPQEFGSSRTNEWWPIGQIETEIRPACKRLLVKSEANYRDALVNGNISSDTGWTKYNAAFSDNGYYLAAAGYIQQTVSFQDAVRRRLKLTVRLRQYRASISDPSSEGTASIQVSMYGRRYSGGRTFYLVSDGNGGYQWSSSSGSITVNLAAPQVDDTDESCEIVEIGIPLLYNGPREYAIAESITVKVLRTSNTIPLLVRSASLTFEEQIAGYQDIFFIDNGAREDASDVETLFLPSLSGRYNTPVEFMYGVLYNYSNAMFSIFDQVGEDYAKSCALPRLLKRGTLNVPVGIGYPPFVMRDTNGYNYIVQTIEWDIYNCEMTVEMLSLPAVSVEISEQQISEVVYKGGETTSSGSTSSGSPGGGTGVQSVGLEMPSGFSVSNTPITGSGTMRVSLDNTLVIPTKTEEAAWNGAAEVAHSHPNKADLDRITEHGADFLSDVDANMLAVAPTIKKFWLQANSSIPTQEQPFFFVKHPLIRMGADAEVCLMIYRKRNGGSGSRKTHRKGWFLACGAGHARNAALVLPVSTVVSGSLAVQVIDILDGIAKTYCQIYGAVPMEGYSDWLYWMTQVAPDFTSFGFAGTPYADNFTRKLHLGIALRMVNPDFTALVDPQRSLHDDTGSIQGIPRYLYSAVAPLTARMYAEAKGGQPRGGVVFDLI